MAARFVAGTGPPVRFAVRATVTSVGGRPTVLVSTAGRGEDDHVAVEHTRHVFGQTQLVCRDALRHEVQQLLGGSGKANFSAPC